jgi:hypothetical protein
MPRSPKLSLSFRISTWNHITNSMELSPSWETASCAATQELASILWNPEVHYRVHKSPPMDPILNQIDPVHATPSYLSKILFNIIHLPTSSLPNGYEIILVWFHHCNSTWWRLEIMNLLVMRVSLSPITVSPSST